MGGETGSKVSVTAVWMLILGQGTAGAGYAADDLDLLEDLAATVASVVHTVRLQAQSVQQKQIDALLREVRHRERALQDRMQEALAVESEPLLLGEKSDREDVSHVEDVLRHLHDYSYLGEHDLARLHIVDAHLDGQAGAFVTHLDRGKALHSVLVTAVEKLKPCGLQASPPSREWYQYIILYDCYVLGRLTREVMGALYISEGTFNRARRQAVRGVTRALGEMERQVRQQSER